MTNLPLTRDTVLRWAPGFRIEAASNHLIITGNDGTVSCAPEQLSLLTRFSTPRTLTQGLELDQASTSGSEWVQASATIMRLIEAGVLVADTGATAVTDTTPHGFGSAATHIAMLNDSVRTTTFVNAVADTVRPGDIVVDLGTGTGVLAMAAARAGAAHVYAIEQTAIGSCADMLFGHNKMRDKITLLRGRSPQVDLPERADVLVSEIIGSEPLAECVLDYTMDAAKRFLKPGARFVPNRLRIYVSLATLDADLMARHRFASHDTEKWSRQYGIDFQALTATRYASNYRFIATASEALRSISLSEPAMVADIDLSRIGSSGVDNSVECAATHTGTADSAIAFFELELAPGQILTNRPDSIDKRSSWHCPIWLFNRPFAVDAGATLAWRYRHTLVATTLDCQNRSSE